MDVFKLTLQNTTPKYFLVQNMNCINRNCVLDHEVLFYIKLDHIHFLVMYTDRKNGTLFFEILMVLWMLMEVKQRTKQI